MFMPMANGHLVRPAQEAREEASNQRDKENKVGSATKPRLTISNESARAQQYMKGRRGKMRKTNLKGRKYFLGGSKGDESNLQDQPELQILHNTQSAETASTGVPSRVAGSISNSSVGENDHSAAPTPTPAGRRVEIPPNHLPPYFIHNRRDSPDKPFGLASNETTFVDYDPMTERISIASASTAGYSFVNLALDSVVKDNPSLDGQISLIKNAIRDYEHELQKTKRDNENGHNEKLWEAMKAKQKAESDAKLKDETIKKYQDKLYQYEAYLKDLEQKNRQAMRTNDQLKIQLQNHTRLFEQEHREHTAKVIQLEREKRGLVDQVDVLNRALEDEQQNFEEERSARIGAENYRQQFDQHLNFYREYFEKQESIYNAYFGKHVENPDGSRSFPRMSTVEALAEEKAIEYREISTRTSASTLGESSAQATASLRQRYRSGEQPLRGQEFLAWVHGGEFDQGNPHLEEAVFDDQSSRPTSAISISEFPAPPEVAPLSISTLSIQSPAASPARSDRARGNSI